MKWINNSGIDHESFIRLCAIADSFEYEHHTEDYASVTSLLQPVKITLLQKRYYHEFMEDPSDVIWRVIGTAVHDVMYRGLGYGKIDEYKLAFANEIIRVLDNIHIIDDLNFYKDSFLQIYNKYQLLKEALSKIDLSLLKRYIAENRIRAPILGKMISGMNDLYDRDTEKIIDYKVTSTKKIIFKDFDEWTAQLNCYAYLRELHGFPVKRLEINAILRDWEAKEAKLNPQYPAKALVILNLDLWSMSRQQSFLERKILQLISSEGISDDEIPICEPNERWQKDERVAVLESNGFILTESAIKTLVSKLDILDSEQPLIELCNRKYGTRREYISEIQTAYRTTDVTFADRYETILCSIAGTPATDAYGKRKRALRLVDRIDQADDWVKWKGLTCEYMYEFRKNEPKRCVGNYCGVRDYCNFWKEYTTTNRLS